MRRAFFELSGVKLTVFLGPKLSLTETLPNVKLFTLPQRPLSCNTALTFSTVCLWSLDQPFQTLAALCQVAWINLLEAFCRDHSNLSDTELVVMTISRCPISVAE